MNTTSIALGTYNPSQVPRETLLAEFTARQDMLSDLLSVVRSNERGQPCQHSLLIGPRGFGKTTSLYALNYSLEADAELSENWTPLLFDEENYQIACLADFWLECLRLVEEKLNPASGKSYPELSLSRDPNLESMAQTALMDVLNKKNRRALLLIDNLNDILGVISNQDEQHRLRAFLMEESQLCVVGTACTYFEAIQNTDQPFYNLFRIFRLDRFSQLEQRDALEAMRKSRPMDGERLPLPDNEGYWKGLHILTGGNPRLVKMVFQLLEQGVTPDFRTQLEGLLDAYTPYFKHRIESMSPQQRRVFDAIAMAWDPVRLSDISPVLRMDSNKVSAQVGTLMDAQLVAIAGGTAKRRLYQIADRFSNIYYFMRYSRAGRSKFEWFVRTMKAVLSPEQYRSQLDRMREQGLACSSDTDLREQMQLLASATWAIDDEKLRRTEGHKSIIRFLNEKQELALKHLLDEPSTQVMLGDEHKVVEFLVKLSSEKRQEIGFQPDDPKWWYHLTDFLEDASLWSVAEQAYCKAIEFDPSDAKVWNGLGNLLTDHLEKYEEAEDAYRKAIELDPKYSKPWNNLGTLLRIHRGRFSEAEKAYQKAIDLNPHDPYPWTGLGNLYKDCLGQYKDAEVAYRQAINFDIKPTIEWNNLGNLLTDHLGRNNEAEIAYRKSIAIDPSYAAPWNGLGNLFMNHYSRYEEAEKAFRKSIELDPNLPHPKAGLAILLAKTIPKSEEALRLASNAVSLAPSLPWALYAVERVIIGDSVLASCSLEFLAKKLIEMPNGSSQVFHQLALGCISLLIRNDCADQVLEIIEKTGSQEIFDIPIQAIKVLKNPDKKPQLAQERLALVEAFLEQSGV